MSTAPRPDPKPGRILIVEDEPRLSAVLRDYLLADGHDCEQVDDGAQAVPAFRRFAPDLVILDLGLPNRDGIDICRELRTLSGQPGRIYSRDQLMDRLYADRHNVIDRTIDSHVRNLRRKLSEAGGGDWIRSVYGVGYRFEA